MTLLAPQILVVLSLAPAGPTTAKTLSFGADSHESGPGLFDWDVDAVCALEWST